MFSRREPKPDADRGRAHTGEKRVRTRTRDWPREHRNAAEVADARWGRRVRKGKGA